MKAKAIVASVLTSPLSGRFLRFVFRGRIPSPRFGGLRIDVRSEHVADRVAAQIFWGVYESGEARLIRQLMRGDLDVIELGSSIGMLSSVTARSIDRGRRLVCVEANEALLPVLRRNLAAHAGHLSCKVLHRAVSYQGDEVRFITSAENTDGQIRADDVHATRDAADVEVMVVPAATLSALLESGGIEGDFAMVCDIEGSEWQVIAHDAASLQRCRMLVIELHDNDGPAATASADDLSAALEGHGFVLRAHYGTVCCFEREGNAD